MFLIFVHVALCIALIFLVLLQQGKGADLGAVFGNSNSLFGAGGAGANMGKITTGLAIVFMVTSILLVRAFIFQTKNPDINSLPVKENVVNEVPSNGKALDGSVLNDVKIQDTTPQKKVEEKQEPSLPKKVN